MKMKKALLASFLFFGTISISSGFDVKAVDTNTELNQANKLIQKKLGKSKEETNEDIVEMKKNGMSDKEILKFAKTVQKGTTDDFDKAVEEKYKEQGITVKNKVKTAGSSHKAIGIKGDIIVDARQGSNSSSNSYWSVGHSALVSKNTSYTIESFAKDWAPKSRIVGGKQKSGPEMYYNRWGGYSKVYLLRAKGRTASKAEKAYAYAKKQVTSNKPYSYQFLNKKRTSHFYCSSLVWRAWYEQSINIDHVKYDSVVTPLELVKSNNTVIIS